MLPMCIGYYWMILRYPQFRKPSAVVFHLVDVLLEKILAFPSLTQSASKSYNSWWPTSIKCCTNPKAAMFFFPVQNEVQGYKQDSNKYVPISHNTRLCQITGLSKHFQTQRPNPAIFPETAPSALGHAESWQLRAIGPIDGGFFGQVQGACAKLHSVLWQQNPQNHAMLLLGNEMIDVWAVRQNPTVFHDSTVRMLVLHIPSHLILVEMGKTQCRKSLNVPGLPKARLNLAVPQTAGRYLKTVENSWYLFI